MNPKAFAFPTVDANREEDYGGYGMTMRDYFAAKAMQSLLSDQRIGDATAADAYVMADAMLKARLYPPPGQ